MVDDVVKSREANEMAEIVLSLEERVKKERETRAERLVHLRGEVERLFPGDELATLRSEIERSFDVPQFGGYHNEGMLMDTHLDRILQIIDKLKRGEAAEGLPPYLREAVRAVVSEHEEEIQKYAFLHDIAKADCIRIQFTDKKPDQDISWEEWQDLVPEDIRRDPVALKDFCVTKGWKAFSYYHEDKKHGEMGAEKIQPFADDLNLPDIVRMIVGHHESAHHFSKVKAETYKKFFQGFSSEEETWVIVASFVDTMASLSEDQKPNLRSFANMVSSIKNYHLTEIVEQALNGDKAIAKNILARKLGDLRKADQVIEIEPHVLLDQIKRECAVPTYDRVKLLGGLRALEISAQFKIEPAIVDDLIAAVDESTGHLDSKVYGNVVSKLKPDQILLLKKILESSRAVLAQVGERRNVLATEKLFDSQARQKFVDIEKFTSRLESSELTKEQKIQLFFETFFGSNSEEKLRLLDEKGVLEELIPEFGRNRNLTQDSRFHGSETVAEHLLRSATLLEKELGKSQPFGNLRFAGLLRLTAFLHDIGKNEDEDKSPEKAGKEGLGYRVVTRKKGEDFERVRFLGHQSQGEIIFQKRIGEINIALSDEERLSPEEMIMVSMWIRNHMRAINVTRDLEEFTPEELAEKIVKDAYPTELLNARIPMSDVLRAGMMIQEVELTAAADSPDKIKLVQGWERVKAEVEKMLPFLEAQNKRELMIPLVRGEDLLALGVPKKKMSAILYEIEQQQVSGELLDRRSALLVAVAIAKNEGVHVQEDQLDALAGQGAYREMRARKENLRLVAEDKHDSFVVRRYETTPVQQFTKDTTIEEMERMIYSGNFPNLVAHLKQYEISIGDLRQVILEKGFANLLQLEFFVKEYCVEGETILNVACTRSPLARAVEISRKMPNGEEANIVVNNGYQGVKDHTGAGLIHIGEQRMEALKQFYRKDGENDDAMVKRFFDEAVINAAGSSTLEIPSDYDPNKYSILLAPIINSNNKQFAGVVIDKTGKKYKVVTTLFQESPKQLRGDLKNMLRRLKERQGFTNEQLLPHLEAANRVLVGVGESLLNLEQLERQQSVPITKDVPKAGKEKALIPDQLKPLGRVLRDKLGVVAEIYPSLIAIKDDRSALEQMVDEIFKNKLKLSEEQIQAILTTL